MGTFSGCRQHGSGTYEFVEKGSGPSRATIHWAGGHATSDVIVSEVPDYSGGPCPRGDVTEHVTITVVHGLYTGSTGHDVICNDNRGFPITHATNFGPVAI